MRTVRGAPLLRSLLGGVGDGVFVKPTFYGTPITIGAGTFVKPSSDLSGEHMFDMVPAWITHASPSHCATTRT
jgi:hypothetical protein